MTRTPYLLTLPKRPNSSVVVASPHSGRVYDAAFLASTVLDARGIRSSEDAYVDMLLENVPDCGAPLLAAQMPRAFVDLNRSVEELDPAVIRDVPRGAINPRVSSGLGVIPRVVANGRAIYRGKISREDAFERIETVWRPYHAQLQALLDEARGVYGQAILVDVHSMPHEAIESMTLGQQRPPEIVLGDRFGASCDGDIVDKVEAIFLAEGFRVARNTPFAGAYITQHYGRPVKRQHAVQIEIDRALYLDEGAVCPHGGFDGFKRQMARAMAQIVAIGQAEAVSLAAE